jgi:excinuclease UvrABC nuclease subunit
MVRGAVAMNLKDVVKTNFVKKMKFTEFDMELSQKHIDGGVYRMFDESGEIIYVGKSGNLYIRLYNHLGHRTNTQYFIDEVVRIDYYCEPNPIYETLLEAVLIAYYQPKYNDEVKDAKKKFGEDNAEK